MECKDCVYFQDYDAEDDNDIAHGICTLDAPTRRHEDREIRYNRNSCKMFCERMDVYDVIDIFKLIMTTENALLVATLESVQIKEDDCRCGIHVVSMTFPIYTPTEQEKLLRERLSQLLESFKENLHNLRYFVIIKYERTEHVSEKRRYAV